MTNSTVSAYRHTRDMGNVYNRLQRRFMTRGIAAVDYTKIQQRQKTQSVDRAAHTVERADAGRNHAQRSVYDAARAPAVNPAVKRASSRPASAVAASRAAGRQPYAQAYAVAESVRRRAQLVRTMERENAGRLCDGVSLEQKTAVPKRGALREFSGSPAKPSAMKTLVGAVLDTGEPVEEIKVKKKAFPLGIILLTMMCSVLVLFVLYNFAQVNEYTRSIASLQKQMVNLSTEEDQLSLKLENREDLRAIEQIATEQIGMVKVDTVEKKFISLRQGDKIEVFGQEDAGVAEQPKIGLLSAIQKNFEWLMEYIN